MKPHLESIDFDINNIHVTAAYFPHVYAFKSNVLCVLLCSKLLNFLFNNYNMQLIKMIAIRLPSCSNLSLIACVNCINLVCFL